MSAMTFGYRWWATAAVASVVLLIAACTASPSVPPTAQSAQPSHATSASSALPTGQTVELSCADAGSGIVPTGDDNPSFGGITLEGLAGSVKGLRPAAVGLTVSAGDTLYFVKAPASLTAGAAITSIELPTASGGYLLWVPAQLWTGGDREADLTQWMTSKVLFDGCADRATTYFGGLLSADPNICLTLRISDAAGESRQVPVGSPAHC